MISTTTSFAKNSCPWALGICATLAITACADEGSEAEPAAPPAAQLAQDAEPAAPSAGQQAAVVPVETPSPAPEAVAFAEWCAQMGQRDSLAIVGADPKWLFLKTELRHLGEGQFWLDDAREGLDPVDVIAKYRDALGRLGVDLVLAPVPAKAAAYPDKAKDGVPMTGGIPADSAVVSLEPFYAALRARGIAVVDLREAFRKARASDDSVKYFCEQDTHWSPRGAELAAAAVREAAGDAPWIKAAAKSGISARPPEDVSIKGDLATGETAGRSNESVTITQVTGPDGELLAEDPASPILLLGDSYTMVFSEGGELHTRGAGVFEHLSKEFGFPLAHRGNRAGGSDSARGLLAQSTMRTPDFWAGKKLVIWMFSEREFTQKKWQVIPPKI